MMNNSIGAYLKDLRLRKGYSLERVSSETKISITILRKLELNELSTLPNITYVKGYVQNILKTLHTPFTKYEFDLIESTYESLGLMKPDEHSESTQKADNPVPDTTQREVQSKGNIYNLASLKSKRIVVALLTLIAIIGAFRFVQKINKQPDLRQNQQTSSYDQSSLPTIFTESIPTIVAQTTATKTPLESITATPEVILTPEPTPTTVNAQYPKFEFKKISDLAVTISSKSEDNNNFILYSEVDRKKIVPGKQNVYVTKVEGESWISYKKDQEQPRSVLLKTGQKFFLNGDQLFLTIGNTSNIKIFYNGQAVQFDGSTGVKSFIFPLSEANKHSLPLFVNDANEKLYFYQEYLPLMNQESNVASPEDTPR